MSVEEELQKKLYDVSAYPIKSYGFDMLSGTMTITVVEDTGDDPAEHIIEFLRVSTQYYLNDTGSDKSRRGIGVPEEGSYLELTSVEVLSSPVDIKMIPAAGTNGWSKDRFGKVNIGIEIWTREMYLEAAEVCIDGESFVVGDW